MDSNDDAINTWHRTFAGAAFNRSWDLIDKPDRSPADEDELLTAVFASRYHWESIGNDENKAIGDWQIAHAASHLGLAPVALRFATSALERTQAAGRDDWLLASCYEGMARAHAVSGDTSERDRYIALAHLVLATLEDPEDRELIESQINTIP